MFKYAFSFYLYSVCRIISVVEDVVALLVTDRGLRSSRAQAKWYTQMLISYIQCSTLPVSCQCKVSLWVVQQDGLVLSLSAPFFFFFFLWRYLGVSSFYPRLPFLFRSWWLTLPPLLLGSSLLWNGIAFSFVKDFLVAASYYSRSEITWNGWKFSKTTGELWCGMVVAAVVWGWMGEPT